MEKALSSNVKSSHNNWEAFAEKAAEQWKLLLGLVVAVLAVIAAMGLMNSIHARKELAASNSLYEAQVAAHKAVADKKYDVAEQAYASVIDAHKGTRAAFEAELLAGDMLMDAGSYEKAAGYYQHAVSDATDPFSKLLAIYTIGTAKESAGKYDEAVKAYEEALSTAGSDFLRPELLMAEARCYEALNQPKKAIEIYKTVQEKYASRSYYSGAASAYEKQLSAGAKL
jgi:tetratricopeptide (TPR) repeat protein